MHCKWCRADTVCVVTQLTSEKSSFQLWIGVLCGGCGGEWSGVCVRVCVLLKHLALLEFCSEVRISISCSSEHLNVFTNAIWVTKIQQVFSEIKTMLQCSPVLQDVVLIVHCKVCGFHLKYTIIALVYLQTTHLSFGRKSCWLSCHFNVIVKMMCCAVFPLFLLLCFVMLRVSVCCWMLHCVLSCVVMSWVCVFLKDLSRQTLRQAAIQT